MARKNRVGTWQHIATFQQHNGRKNDHGLPTVDVDSDWRTVLASWPCELMATSGGEQIRGRQVTAVTTHVLFGDYFAAKNVTPDLRVQVNGLTLQVISAFDPDGQQFEMRIEAKREL